MIDLRRHSTPLRSRRWRILAALLALTALAPATAAARTVVTLGFDESAANHAVAAPLLESFGMRGVFFANSCLVQGDAAGPLTCPRGRPADPRVMSWAMVRDLYARGHEIGSHTLSRQYVDPRPEEICPDRDNLLAQGLAVTSFAYASPGLPFEQGVARGCGFNSARITHGLISARCPTCAAAETLPPENLFRLRIVEQSLPTATAAELAAPVVMAAAAGGGWVQYAFNDVCDTCRHRTSVMRGFLTWLRDAAPPGTVVQTTDQVMGGSLQPPSSAAAGPGPPPRPGSAVTISAAGDTIRPAIAALTLSRRRFTARGGATVGYAVTESSTVRFSVQRRLAGRRVGKRCEPTKRTGLARRQRCWAYRTVSRFDHRANTLIRRVRFRGSRTRRLRHAGSYRLHAVATDRAGNRSKARTARFRVVRPRR